MLSSMICTLKCILKKQNPIFMTPIKLIVKGSYCLQFSRWSLCFFVGIVQRFSCPL